MVFLVLFKHGKVYDFMGKRKLFYALSAVLIGISFFAFWKPGPKWGTDFRGGTEVVVQFTQGVESGAVREAVEEIKEADGKSAFDSPEVVSVPNKPNAYLIRVQEVSSLSDEARNSINKATCFSEQERAADCTEATTPTDLRFSPGGDKVVLRYDLGLEKLDEAGRTAKKADIVADVTRRLTGISGVSLSKTVDPVQLISERDGKIEVHLASKGDVLMEGLKAKFGAAVPDHFESVEWIGPKAGAELRDMALKAIGITMIFIMLYIAIRFDLRFAPGAIVSLFHDVVVALGAMCLTQREITLTTVAAVLTVMGYSISDTVVVYDRVRENLGKHRGKTFPELVNLSVSEMFGRTVITNLTVALSLLAFLYFGTQVIKDFAFAMLVGVGVGTYSSIYIAAPITEWVDRRLFAGGMQARRGAKVPRVRSQKKADAVV
ncbi:MAG: protein translocase subunit SecF [Polyangiaceae bacterium]|nr:protein translocase subunit SecF [Polyangiaceae bacterium]